ncbi:MAG: aminotransferase class III-fold pyridoxal phosphate-dependent enzyme, partial [Rikenellaceae bacterium]
AVVIEPIQGEGGYRIPTPQFMEALRAKCTKEGALLIFDEIQTGFGRTGEMFAWKKIGITPDIICMAKAMGGGMPIGGFAATKEMMDTLTFNPVLGHITTFGGHPVSAAAGLAAMKYIEDNDLMAQIKQKQELFCSLLSDMKHLKEIRHCGLMIALDFHDTAIRDKVVLRAMERGVITEGYLFCETAMRVAPPLTITLEQIEECSALIKEAAEF